MKSNYSLFDKFVIRIPLLSFGSYTNKVEIVQSTLFREAIEIASPDLFDITRNIEDEQSKQSFSLLKYLLRASTRCTPFGLFAGCAIGCIAEDDYIVLQDPSYYHRCTRLDMQYLCALIQHLEKLPDIKYQLKFYPNDSLYKIGGKFRYIEYHYINGRRFHNISAIEYDEYLTMLIEKARQGATINELCASLTGNDISLEDAQGFINDIIENQILKSEIDPSVVGEDVLTGLIRKLSNIKTYIPELDVLKLINAQLEQLNSYPLAAKHNFYNEISTQIDKLGVNSERKYLFQTDLCITTERATISAKIPHELLNAVEFLSKISTPFSNPILETFIKAFYKRFEEQEVPLTLALDTELGVGYPVGNEGYGDVSPLLDKLILPKETDEMTTITISQLDSVLIRKLIETLHNNKIEIELTDTDFPNMQFNIPSWPDTLAIMCSVVNDPDNNCDVLLRSAGGSSAANLLGRFCHVDSAIEDMVYQITNKEAELNPDILLAEISHLPESRIGNIASRPRIRQYVIHYLSNTDDHTENDLTVDDLLLSYRNGRLILKSKKYNKEVRPHLTCAHNHLLSPIPIYRFLCDYQTYNIQGGINFSWNPLFEYLDYLPRVRYGRVILSRQRWRIKEDEINHIITETSDETLLIAAHNFIQKKHITHHVVIPDGDNELFLDLMNPYCWRLLGRIIAKRKTMILREHLFNEQTSLVRDNQGRSYTNEVIFMYYKN